MGAGLSLQPGLQGLLAALGRPVPAPLFSFHEGDLELHETLPPHTNTFPHHSHPFLPQHREGVALTMSSVAGCWAAPQLSLAWPLLNPPGVHSPGF